MKIHLPKLSTHNMHKGDLDGSHGTHCLLGWVAKCSRGNKTVALRIQGAIQTELRRRGIEDHIPHANDNILTKAQAAEIWNAVADQLDGHELDEFVWVTAHGQELLISQIENGHLLNIIALGERKPKLKQARAALWPKLLEEAERRGLKPHGPAYQPPSAMQFPPKDVEPPKPTGISVDLILDEIRSMKEERGELPRSEPSKGKEARR